MTDYAPLFAMIITIMVLIGIIIKAVYTTFIEKEKEKND